MSVIPGYERDPYLAELDTEVLAVRRHEGRVYALLSDTILYPEGGGQPADRGWLGDIEVVDVHRVGPELRHVLAAPVAPGTARLRLDWGRRFDHMQQHTAQHLLTAIAEDRRTWATTAFHLGERVSDVELDVPSLDRAQLDELEDAICLEIRTNRQVRTRRVDANELPGLRVRTRGLPPDHSGDVRLVEIAGVDCNTCGGTHLSSLAEIETVKLLGTEPMRGGTRVFFAAGGRVRRLLAAARERDAALRTILGAPDEELAATATARLEELRLAERRNRDLEAELAQAVAVALAGRSGTVVDHHLENHDIAFLQQLGRLLAAAAPEKLALLTAGRPPSCFFVLVAGTGVGSDIQGLGRGVAGALAGRGGGAERLFQGKCPDLNGRNAAIALLHTEYGG